MSYIFIMCIFAGAAFNRVDGIAVNGEYTS